ncbi:unnamed protein product, partial [Rotaria sordida]
MKSRRIKHSNFFLYQKYICLILGDDKIGRSRLLQFIADSLENSNNENHNTTISCHDNTYTSHDSTIPITTNDNKTHRSS